MEFDAETRTISDALTLRREYLIPRFQREYSWEIDELDELWDDLIENLKVENGKLTASEYFIGSLVLVDASEDTKSVKCLVVDGQQRLMTFTLHSLF